MAEAIEAPAGLAGLIGCYMAIGFFAILSFTLVRLIQTVDINLPVVGHPFHGIAKRAENAVTDGCNIAIRQLDKWATFFENMLIDAFGLLLAIPALEYAGIRAAMHYLWNKALMPRVHSVTDAIEATAKSAHSLAKQAERDIANEATRRAQEISAAYKTLRSDISDAIRTFHKDVVNPIENRVKSIESTIEHTIAPDASKALTKALDAEKAVAGIGADVATAVATSIGSIPHDIALAEGEIAVELPQLPGLAWDDINSLLKRIPFTKLAGLLAAIPLLRVLVQTLAREAGLDNAECRGKVKGICATDPAEWENLMGLLVGGLALVDFYEMASISRGVMDDLREGARAYAWAAHEANPTYGMLRRLE